ncbi:MAG: hypothetical protein ACFFC7_27065 [Candidatus Hermodarchaeota archaeon]
MSNSLSRSARLEPAKELGVNLQIKYSKYRNQYYVVHLCPKCKNDKFYCPERGKYDLSPPGNPLRVGFYWWCSKCDKWEKLRIIEWNEMESSTAYVDRISIELSSD